MTREALLRKFFEVFWNSGDIDSADRFVCAPYTVAPDPATDGTNRH